LVSAKELVVRKLDDIQLLALAEISNSLFSLF